MNKHTPSPWKIKQKFGAVYAVIKNEDDWICDVCVSDNDESNACLIAAAPELLEALNKMLDSFCDPDCGEFDCKLAVKDAKVAIAKATGGQNV